MSFQVICIDIYMDFLIALSLFYLLYLILFGKNLNIYFYSSLVHRVRASFIHVSIIIMC